MKTMAKVGIFSTVSAVLLLLAVGPALGAPIIEYRILIDGADASSITNFSGTHVLSVEVRTNATAKWTAGGMDYYGGVTTVGYSLKDSSGIPGLIEFAANGTAWAGTVSSDFTGTKAPGSVNAGTPTPNDVNRGQAISTTAGGGYGPAATGGMGGHAAVPAGTVVDFSTSWYQVVSGNFTFSGTNGETATLSLISLGNTYNKAYVNGSAVVATAMGTGGAILDAVTFTAPDTGGPSELYTPHATAALAANALAVHEPAIWHHPVPGWWQDSAFFTLDGTEASNVAGGADIKTWQWKLTDADGQHSLVFYGEHPMVTVRQLKDAGFATPPPLPGGVGPLTYGSLSLKVYAGVGASDGELAQYDWGQSAGGAQFLLPEPASLVVLGLGAVAGLIRRRRR